MNKENRLIFLAEVPDKIEGFSTKNPYEKKELGDDPIGTDVDFGPDTKAPVEETKNTKEKAGGIISRFIKKLRGGSKNSIDDVTAGPEIAVPGMETSEAKNRPQATQAEMKVAIKKAREAGIRDASKSPLTQKPVEGVGLTEGQQRGLDDLNKSIPYAQGVEYNNAFDTQQKKEIARAYNEAKAEASAAQPPKPEIAIKEKEPDTAMDQFVFNIPEHPPVEKMSPEETLDQAVAQMEKTEEVTALARRLENADKETVNTLVAYANRIADEMAHGSALETVLGKMKQEFPRSAEDIGLIGELTRELVTAGKTREAVLKEITGAIKAQTKNEQAKADIDAQVQLLS